MRKVLGSLHLKCEWLIFTASLIVGMATIQLAIGGHVWGIYKFPGRLLLMFPGFQMGKIYKEKIESRASKRLVALRSSASVKFYQNGSKSPENQMFTVRGK